VTGKNAPDANECLKWILELFLASILLGLSAPEISPQKKKLVLFLVRILPRARSTLGLQLAEGCDVVYWDGSGWTVGQGTLQVWKSVLRT
jgi:hypothetical protein